MDRQADGLHPRIQNIATVFAVGLNDERVSRQRTLLEWEERLRFNHVLVTSAFLLLPGIVMAADEEPYQPSVRLPGIVHKWRKPGEESKLREITIEQVGQCMGSDMDIRARAHELTRRQAVLEAEVEPFRGRAEELGKARAIIAEERSALEEMAENHKRQELEMTKRRAQIQRDKDAKALSAAESKKLNARIAKFNTDVATANKRRDQILTGGKSLDEKLENYNRDVQLANEQVAAFAKRNEDFMSDADRFEKDLARYKAECEGRQVLKK